MKFKIMNYNVFYGFHTLAKPVTLEKNRLELAKKIVTSEDPDILILTEACFGGTNPAQIYLDYKKVFGFPYVYFGSFGKNTEWGSFLLSRHKIVKCFTVPFADRTVLRSTIKLNEKFVNIDILHPNPGMSENKKVKAIKPLLDTLKKPYILAGDFNSLSDEDFYDKATLIEGFKSFIRVPFLFRGLASRYLAYQFLQRKLIPFIRSYGLKDSFEDPSQRIFTVPTDLVARKKYSAMRIDYLFVSQDIKIKDAYVLKNKRTELASDHYPIVGIFEL